MSSFLAFSMDTSFLPGDSFPFDDLLDEIGKPEDTTPEQAVYDWGLGDSDPTTNMANQPPESPISADQEAQQCSSLSPEDNNPQFTPSSTTLDLADDHDDVGDAVLGFGSSQTNSPTDGYEHISLFSSHSSTYSYNSQLEPHSTGAAIVYTDQSRDASSDPVSSPSQQQQWSSFSTVGDAEVYSTPPLAATSYDFVGFTSAGPGSFNVSTPAGMTLPFRPAQISQAWPATTSPAIQSQAWTDVFQPMPYPSQPPYGQPALQPTYAVQNHHFPHPPAMYMQTLSIRETGQPMNNGQQQLSLQHGLDATYQSTANASPRNVNETQSSHTRAEPAHSTRRRFPHLAATREQEGVRPGQRRLVPVSARVIDEDESRATRGGRQKHSHLNESARKKSSAMRKKGACWRCKIQRDTCPDDGTPCQRCLNFFESHKNHQHFFACDRSKLPDFVMDFLPPSYTTMHSKQSIEDCVQEQVRYWDFGRPVEVYLTSGYGHPIRWTLHEFEPATLDLLGQYQYLQNVQTRQSVRYEKWSPPLGIIKLEPSDDWRLKNYLDELMSDAILPEFPWRCYDEESQFDDFQAEMLSLICQLYQKTRDPELRPLLRKIIRMQIITYIMGHTLTITPETLPWVHSHLRNPNKPVQPAPYTSPRLANRQLKFFFHVLREQIFADILKWQQATFQTAARKDSTWLSTFTVMLAFAMVLEECQRTMQIQADAKARKRESSADAAQQEAYNACERIDARFALLVGLFQHKYRDRKWTRNGSFGPQTPLLSDPAEHEFCEELRNLLIEKQQHLRERKDVQFSSQTQCFYTTRLVARFLLPFLDLPA